MSKISIKNLAKAIELETEHKSGAELSSTLTNVATFLYRKKLLNKSKDILEELEKEIDRKHGRIKMKVKSAVKLHEVDKKNLEHEIKLKYQAKEIESYYTEDRNLLGGLRIEVGEEVIDTTYRNKLNQLQKHLINK